VQFKAGFIFLILSVTLTSCTSVRIKEREITGNSVIIPRTEMYVGRRDIVHVVGPSETLWRISKMYDVRIEDIVRANNLTNITKLERGQELTIPAAAPVKPVIPLYKTNKWKYIIIHHSASDEGNSLFFRSIHLSKGWNEVGYDFVIDNGSMGKAEGQIEVGPRWIKQQDGAHCAASGMNYNGIGICLVGNFSKEKVSQKQLDSLDYLVNLLRKYYRIPLKNIMGHGQVPGAQTECPGKLFPWKEFRQKLDN